MNDVILSFGTMSNRLQELAGNLAALQAAPKVGVVIAHPHWVTPLLATPIAAELARTARTVRFLDDEIKSDAESYLHTIGFPDGRDSGTKRPGQSYLPLTRVPLRTKPDELENAANFYIDLVISELDKTSGASLKSSLSYMFGEIVANVIEHSRAERFWMCAQLWPKLREIEICMVDDGVGLRSRFAEAGIDFSSDTDAVEAAIQGKSAKSPPDSSLPGDRGYGLGSTNRLVTGSGLRGSFLLISGDGGYLRHHNKVAKRFAFPARCYGTLLAFKFKLPRILVDPLEYAG